MKNLDIEQLERKNIYKAPDDFFEKVQANVLQETVYKLKTTEPIATSEPKKLNTNWWYAAAAAIALIFGITFFFNKGGETETQIAQNTTAENTEISPVNTVANIDTSNKTEALPNTENRIAPTNVVAENSAASQPKMVIKQNETLAKNEKPRKTSVAEQNTKEQMEMILASFSAEEIATLSKNSEQDVYLDLYY